MPLCFLSFTAKAQKGTLQFNVNYNYGISLGAFNSDLVSNSSPRRGRGGIMYSFSDRLSPRIESGYQDCYQKYPHALYSLSKSQGVSAVLTNSIHTIPLLAKAKYFLTPTGAVKPYVSLGSGANIVDFKQYLGEFGSGQASVGFLAQGETWCNHTF